MGLYPIPEEQKTEEDKFLAKAYFLKDSQANSLIPDKYVWHRQLFALRMLCHLQYLFSVSCTQLLHIKFMSSSVVNFFRSLVHNTMSTREERGIVRPDMIHLLMQAKKGTLQADDNATTTGKSIKPSMCKK